ncbi:uncharacterized protein LOC131624671 [Vicia villosa]|uniref:uncharacterized protein LOC131624671 n=1 Tax=Vicia villosa TaxID=3911 RepID=UPI00273C1948|nr:uncharacterized protein LOC131624671 [Vicia villosa]
MKPPSQPVKTKGAPKKLKPTPNDYSTTQAPSYCEHVDNIFLTHQLLNKGARIRKPPPTPIPLKIPFIKEIPIFMHKYIKWIVNVEGDGNCGYRAVSSLLGNGEDSHTLVRHQLIQELKTHKDSYTRLYGEEIKFEAVYKYLVPWSNG